MSRFEDQCKLAELQARVGAEMVDVRMYDSGDSVYSEESYVYCAEMIRALAQEMRELGKGVVKKEDRFTNTSYAITDTDTDRVYIANDGKNGDEICDLLNELNNK